MNREPLAARSRGAPFALLAVLALAGCGESGLPGGNEDAVRHQLPLGYAAVLEQADVFEVLSLDPDGPAGPTAPRHGAFHGYPVLGRVRVTRRGEQRRIVADVYRGIAEASGVALCFIPHHGLIAQRGSDRIEMLVCYTCLQIQVFAGAGDPATVATTPASRRALEIPLRRARIPLAPDLL